MLVPLMVGVWIVWVFMGQWLVRMRMVMPGSGRHGTVVLVLVVLVMNVFMIVYQGIVRVLVFMVLGQMQPNA